VEGGASNSESRLRSGFSPSEVRKSVQRERMLPAMCFTMTAMEFDFAPRTPRHYRRSVFTNWLPFHFSSLVRYLGRVDSRTQGVVASKLRDLLQL